MTRYLAAYIATAAAVATLGLLWLGVIAKPIYQQALGHLLAERPNFVAAALFYLVFAMGLMFFAMVPNESSPAWGKTLVAAALLGLFAYATYDLTNLATLKNWPIGVTLLDIAWGGVISVMAAAAGKLVLNQLAAG